MLQLVATLGSHQGGGKGSCVCVCMKASVYERCERVNNSTFTSLLFWTCLLILHLNSSSSHLPMPSSIVTSAHLIFTSSQLLMLSSEYIISSSHLHIFSLPLSLSLSYSRPLPQLHILTLCHLPSYDDSHTYTYDYAPVRSRAIRTLVVKNVCTVEQQQQQQQQQ